MITVLRKKFDMLKDEIEKMNADKNSIQLFNDAFTCKSDLECVNNFLMNSKFSKKEIFEFYVNECTGFSENEIDELLFSGKSRPEVVKIKDSIKEALKYKLLCEFTDNV